MIFKWIAQAWRKKKQVQHANVYELTNDLLVNDRKKTDYL